MNENDLMSRLAASKAIMDATENRKRGDVKTSNLPQNTVSEFSIPRAKYNIPQEFLSENSNTQNPSQFTQEIRENTKPVGVPTVDAIKNSKLPDEIKRLMIEHPIEQPKQQGITISNDLIEKASRLMKTQNNNYIPESAKPKGKTIESSSQSPDLKQIVKEAVREILKENGIITESTEKTNEIFSFKVGKHIFEGKVTRVKKIS